MFVPRLFWYQCDKCKNEFRNEQIYELEYPLILGHYLMGTIYGCSRCFDDMEGFKEYCNQKYIHPIIKKHRGES